MRRLLLIIILCNSYAVHSQLDSASKALLFDLLKPYLVSDTFIYSHFPGRFGKSLEDNFKQGVIYDLLSGDSSNHLMLTGKEKAYLKESWNRAKEWEAGLFPTATAIPHDSLWASILGCRREFISAAQKDPSLYSKISEPMYRKCRVYFFSPPFVFRKKTLLLFNIGWMCGPTCGHHEMYMYRLENGVYKKWLLLDAGDW